MKNKTILIAGNLVSASMLAESVLRLQEAGAEVVVEDLEYAQKIQTEYLPREDFRRAKAIEAPVLVEAYPDYRKKHKPNTFGKNLRNSLKQKRLNK